MTVFQLESSHGCLSVSFGSKNANRILCAHVLANNIWPEGMAERLVEAVDLPVGAHVPADRDGRPICTPAPVDGARGGPSVRARVFTSKDGC